MTCCGIPYIDLLGTKEDWVKLIDHWKTNLIPCIYDELLEEYKDLVADFIGVITNILEKILFALDNPTSPEVIKFFREIISILPQRQGSGYDDFKEFTGWLINFYYFDSRRFKQNIPCSEVKTMDFDNLLLSRCVVEILVRETEFHEPKPFQIESGVQGITIVNNVAEFVMGV